MTGSLTDQLALIDAFNGHQRAERLAKLLNSEAGWDNENARYLVLVRAAMRCGYRPNLTEICRDWAARRVETIRRVFPNNVEAAGL